MPGPGCMREGDWVGIRAEICCGCLVLIGPWMSDSLDLVVWEIRSGGFRGEEGQNQKYGEGERACQQ